MLNSQLRPNGLASDTISEKTPLRIKAKPAITIYKIKKIQNSKNSEDNKDDSEDDSKDVEASPS